MHYNHKKHRGFSLLEMLIVTTIISLVMIGMNQLFVSVWRSQKYQMQLSQASFLASHGVSKMIKEIREAQIGADGSFPIASIDSYDIAFFSNADDDVDIERIHYYLNNGVLYRGISNPLVGPPRTYPVGDDSVTIVSNHVVNTDSNLLFEFYDEEGDVLSMPAVPGLVRLVRVSLLIDIDPFLSPEPVLVSSVTAVRNLVNK